MSGEHKLRRGGTPYTPAPILQDPFAPYKAKPTTTEWVILILLLGLAVFLRLYRLSDVPPGIHDDEIINAEITDRLLSGEPIAPFYEAGTGKRETLFFFLLAASRLSVSPLLGNPYWLRLPSVLCSLLTMYLVYRLARRWFGPWAALVAAGGFAISFWPVYLGREALRSCTVPLVGGGMTLALWRGLNQSDRGARGWFALAGLLLGLTQYTYPAARVLPLFVALFIAYLAIFHRDRLSTHRWGLTLCVAIGAIVAAPALVYIATHWGEQHRIMTLKGPLEAFLTGNPRPVISSTVKTLGMFVWRGDPQPHYNLPGRPVFGPVSGILFLAGVLIALLDLRHPASAFCLLWTMTALVPGMLTQPAPHFSRTAGALLTTFIFPGIAVRWLVDRLNEVTDNSQLSAAHLIGAALVILLSVNAGLTFRDYFLRWTELKEVRAFHHAGLAEMARYLDHSPEAIADTTPIAACTPFLNEAHFFWRTDRQALRYLLNRRDLQIGWYSCLEAQLFPRGGEESRYLFGGEWDFASFTPPELTGQAQTIAEFRGGRLARLDAAQAGEYGLENWLAQMSRPEVPSPTTSFGEMMTFRGYRIAPDAPVPGAELEVLTAWEVDSVPPQNLSIFLHLFDSDGTLLTQGDALAALSDTLHPGDVFVQRHKLALPPDMPPGEYSLKTGLYVRDGARIPLASSADDALILETVKIGDDNN